MARESATSRSGPGFHEATTVRLAPLGTPTPPVMLVLGRYRPGVVLGRGGMATVYRGEDTLTGRDVAIKVLAPHLSADPAFRGRMLAEARAVARLPHPHIVQVYDAGQESPTADALGERGPPGSAGPPGQDGAVALIMELVPGEALDRRIARGPLPLATVVDMATQVADALAFAHARGVIHRDVKPHNILLTDPPDGQLGQATGSRPQAHPGEMQGSHPDGLPEGVTGRDPEGAAASDPDGPPEGVAGSDPLGRPNRDRGAPMPEAVWVKLADFGIARSLDATTSYTATGLVMGSAPYIAPEVLQGAAGDERADVYSLGATLFEALAGRLPFVGTTAAQALTQRLTQSAPLVGTFRPDVPHWLEVLVGQCLEREPARRIGSAAALARALRQADVATEVLSIRRADLTSEVFTAFQADVATEVLSVRQADVARQPRQRITPPPGAALVTLLAVILLVALPATYLAVIGARDRVRPGLVELAQEAATPVGATTTPSPAATAPPTVTPPPAATAPPTVTPPPAATALPTVTPPPAATAPPSIRVVLPAPSSAGDAKDGARIAAEARERAAALREQLRARQQALRENARAPERKPKSTRGNDDG